MSALKPYGVNLGGWFCLEDWFYSKSTGAGAGHCVATPNPEYDEASTLSTSSFVGDVETIFRGLTSEERHQLARGSFGCEADLVNLLLKSGFSQGRVVDLFWQHRRCYIMPLDFARLRTLGIRRVRLPLTWCISYETAYTIRGKDWSGRDTSTSIVPGSHIVEDPLCNDPAFDPSKMRSASDKWISIPIAAVEHILETAADYNIQVLIDIHAFPGGSSAGTFNGVWPNNPRFWSAHRNENFETIICKLLDWMELLCHRNPKAFSSLYGLTPMNEPAHLRGLFDEKGAKVPVTYQKAYDDEGRKNWAAISATEVLETLAISVKEFRRRPALVDGGKRLVMNIIETAFNGCFGGEEDAGAFAASQRGETDAVAGAIGGWWQAVTTEEERRSWAVLDIHNYISWNPDVVKFRDMSNMQEYQNLIEEMSLPFFRKLRDRLQLPKPQLLACSEYSASTDQDTFLSVTSGSGLVPPKYPSFDWQSLRDFFLSSQHQAAAAAGIDMWFWTYHIRNNLNYQGEWSLQHILSPWPRLRRRLQTSPNAAACALEILRGSGGCLLHFTQVALHLVLAFVKSPCRGIWRQAFGLRFSFDHRQ